MYDRHGEEALKEGGPGGGGGGMGDIFEMFMGGHGGGGRGPAGPKKSKPVMHPLKLSLEDLYKGKSTKVVVNRDRICVKCEGRGGKAGAVETCSSCNGRGMRTQMRMVGPGMYTQS